MSGHTKGPWMASAVLPKRSNFDRVRRCRIGPLADALKTVGYAEGETAEEAVANGRMQAAAPELADALEAAREACEAAIVAADYEGKEAYIRAKCFAAAASAAAALRKAGRLP